MEYFRTIQSERQTKGFKRSTRIVEILYYTKKKFTLVLDDIKYESQIEDIVLLDILCGNNGSTLIVTIQDWKAMKDYYTKVHVIDIKGFN